MSKARGLAAGRMERAALLACRHDGAVPVESLSSEVVAWLCPDCDEQLDAGFTPPRAPEERMRPLASMLTRIFDLEAQRMAAEGQSAVSEEPMPDIVRDALAQLEQQRAEFEAMQANAWYRQPLPPVDHQCRTAQSGSISTGAFYERCACGGSRRDGGPWMERNSRSRP